MDNKYNVSFLIKEKWLALGGNGIALPHPRLFSYKSTPGCVLYCTLHI